ncbi:hypothetical protein AYO44_03335 [Planctomycetaceae bacterium SCGC AG-212-F19]|nr:hypothetical protein AYO44_03335 [Planctomycetaceae bacterium SCGC AG-212-F19]
MESRSKPAAPAPPTPAGETPLDDQPLQDWLTTAAAAGGDALPSWLSGDLPDFVRDETAGIVPSAPAPAPTAPPPVARPAPAAVRPSIPRPIQPARPSTAPTALAAPTHPKLRVALSKPSEMEVQQPAYFLIQVSNTGSVPVNGVKLRLALSTDWSFAEHIADGIALGRLAAGAIKRFRLAATPLRGGALALPFTLTADEAFYGTGHFTVAVRDTTLGLTVKVTSTARIDDEIEATFGVTNPAEQATGVIFVTLPVPEGLTLLTASDGGMYEAPTRGLLWRLPGLAGGESRMFTARFRAEAPGDFALHVAGQSAGRVVLPIEAALRVELDPATGGAALDELVDAIDRDLVRAVQVHAHRLRAPARPMPEVGTANRYVFFSTGAIDCAIPLSQVLEIGQPHAITPVPNVPDWVVGVANVRGDIVSLVDLGRFLDVAPAGTPHGPVLLVRAHSEELTTGLIVSRVRGIRTVLGAGLQLPSAAVPVKVRAWAGGMTEADARPVVVLDLERLLLSSEMRL